MNLPYSFSGIRLVGLRNKVTTEKGLQISSINTCKGGRVVRIGLINRMDKRIIPFVNFGFKKAVKRVSDAPISDKKLSGISV